MRGMGGFDELSISRAIAEAYHRKFSERLESDVAVVGSGPAGLVAAWKLSAAGHRVTIIEKRLSPGGGIWGGSMGMNEVVVQPEAKGVLEEASVRLREAEGLWLADAAEMACALCLQAVQAGAAFLNLLEAEDVCVREGRVTGVVANRSLIGERLPIDPITFRAECVIDATGHEAVLAAKAREYGLWRSETEGLGDGPMWAERAERFVVEQTREICPGLWIAGMSVAAALRGPRMGPIFGGMLLSGLRAAEQIAERLGDRG